MLAKKSKEQREYLLKLKKEITAFLVNYKKRYQLFPWSQVNKVSKMKLNSTTPIVVNGTKFTVKELVKVINTNKTKINGMLKPSSYNYILRAYIKDSYRQTGSNLKNVYDTYHLELKNVFKMLNQDLLFCLQGLKEMNKVLSKDIKDGKNINESTNDSKLEFDTPESLYKWMHKNIKYDDSKDWKLRSVEEIIHDKKGNCHDQALFAKKYLGKMDGIKSVGCMFLMEFKGDKLENCGKTHTLTYFFKNGSFYWFENAWYNEAGINGPYKPILIDLVDDVRSKWIWDSNYDKLFYHKLGKVVPGMDLEEYCSTNVPDRKIVKKDYYTKESEDSLNMDDELMLTIIESEIDFDNDEIFEEGTNSAISAELRTLKFAYNKLTKECKESIANANFDEARQKVRQMQDVIKKTEAKIKIMDTNAGEAALSIATKCLKEMVKGIILFNVAWTAKVFSIDTDKLDSINKNNSAISKENDKLYEELRNDPKLKEKREREATTILNRIKNAKSEKEREELYDIYNKIWKNSDDPRQQKLNENKAKMDKNFKDFDKENRKGNGYLVAFGVVAAAKVTLTLITETARIIDRAKKEGKVTPDTFNIYKNKVLACVKKMGTDIDKLEKDIDNAEKQYKKVIKESEDSLDMDYELMLTMLESEIDFDNDDIFEETMDTKGMDHIHTVFFPIRERLEKKGDTFTKMCENNIKKGNTEEARKCLSVFSNYIDGENKRITGMLNKYDEKYPYRKCYDASNRLRLFKNDFSDFFGWTKEVLSDLQKEIEKAEKNKKPIKESEDSIDMDYELMLTMLESEIDFDNDGIVEEGVNKELSDKYDKFAEKFDTIAEKCEVCIKENQFDKAEQYLSTLEAILRNAKNETKSAKSTKGDIIISNSLAFLRSTIVVAFKSLATALTVGVYVNDDNYYKADKDKRDVQIEAVKAGVVTAAILALVEAIKGAYKIQKRVGKDEKLNIEHFNDTKNQILDCYDYAEKVIKELRISLKAKQKYLKKLDIDLQESEDLSLYDTELMAIMIESLSEEIFGDEDDVVEEGANLESRKYFNFAKKEFKNLCKEYKKNIRAAKFKEARKNVDMMKSILTRTEKVLDEKEGDLGSTILGWFADSLRTYATSYLIMLPGTVGLKATITGAMTANPITAVIGGVTVVLGSVGYLVATIVSIKEFIKKICGIINEIKKPGDVTADTFNLYRNNLKTETKVMLKLTDKLKEHIDEVEDAYKESLKEQKKAAKAVKESEEFDREKLAIYEACHNGEITVEEREELLYELENKKYINETTDVEESVMSSYEKFGKVAQVLYNRCANGEITVEERESLLLKARDMIMQEETADVEKNIENADNKEADTAEEVDAKDIEKEFKED